MSNAKTYAKSVFKSEGVKTSVVRFKEVKPMQLHVEVKEDGKVAINNHYHNGTEFVYSAENITFATDAENLEKFAKQIMQAAQVLKKLVKVEKPAEKPTETIKFKDKDIEITPEIEIALGLMLEKLAQQKSTKGGKKGK